MQMINIEIRARRNTSETDKQIPKQ